MRARPKTESVDHAIELYNAGVNYHRSGQLPRAICYYLQAIQNKTDFIEAWFNLGNAHLRIKNASQAVRSFEKAIQINPLNADAHYNLGIAHERNGDMERALSAYMQSLCIDPKHAKALNNIGVIWRDRERLDQAMRFFKKAVGVNPELAEAHYNMGVALQKNGEFDKGIQSYQNALRIDPAYAPARWFSLLALPMFYNSGDDIRKLRARFAANLDKLIQGTPLETVEQRQNALQGAAVFTNFFLQYQGQNDIDLQRTYGVFIHRLMTACYPQWSKSKYIPSEPHGKIRIGYASSFMYGHTVGDFLLGWVKNHDLNDFQINCYHLGSRQDSITQRLRTAATAFSMFHGDLESAAAKIKGDNLHVLVYTDIGMHPLSMQLAALKLAPVQCVHFGHPVTSGLPTIDYFLSSELMEPEGADAHYTEQLIRLPNLSVSFTPPELPAEPKPRSAFGIEPDRFVFLSTQSLYKYLPQHDDIYPGIALKAPQALFVFLSGDATWAVDCFKQRLFDAFNRAGLHGEQFCRFLPKLRHADFLGLNMCADILLDSLEWSGCHTTLEALACGLPVVTTPGALMRGRHSYAILMMMGLQDTIAADKQAYIGIATRLATDRTFYKKARHDIATNRQLVFDDVAVVRRLEDFYRSITNRTTVKNPSLRGNVTSTVHDDQAFRYLRTLEEEPDNLKAAFELGSLYLSRNDGKQALKWLLQVRERLPESAAVHNNIGKAYLLANNPHLSMESFQKACALDPCLAEVWFNLAELHQRAGSLEQAVLDYRKAICSKPDMSAAYNNMGNALRDLKRYPEAIAAFNKVIELEPDLAQGHYNLGSTLRLNGQFQQAMVHLSKAIQLQPDYIDAWNNLALTCKNVGDLDRARKYLNKALELDPNFALAHWNRSFVLFLQNDWEQGWQDFEWRFQVPHWRSIYPHRISGRRWDGSPINSQTLLIHDEQGLGDTFQFARFLPWARERCGRLIFETRQELVSLLENTLGIDEIIIRSNTAPPSVLFDQYSPLMSLGCIAKADPYRMHPVGAYIKAPKEKIRQWRECLTDNRPNIGLVWAGRPEHGNDANRSCKLDFFAPLFDLPGFNFIGLQKGPAAVQAKTLSGEQRFENWGDHLKTFSDTAGLIHHLDLVLTVDTSVAHLAGAMGRPVWVLIPFLPDWRWGMHTVTTPWYPSMRLFRQPEPMNWETVIENIKHRLVNQALQLNQSRKNSGI